MAELDAAGPGPIGGSHGGQKPTYTLRDAQAAAERSLAPLRAAAAALDIRRSPVLAVLRQYEADQQRLAASVGHQPAAPLILESIEPARQPLSEEEIRVAVADEVRKAIAEATSKKDRKPRGDSTCERLRDLHTETEEGAEFAETAPLRKLAERVERSTGAVHDSAYYQTKLKPEREKIAARKKAAKAAQKWGDFNSTGRLDEANEDH
jgi:hypothetical protein